MTTAPFDGRTGGGPCSLSPQSFPTAVDSERPGADRPFDYPEYVGTRLRAPKEPLVIVPAHAVRADRPGLRRAAARRARQRPHAPARRRAARRADHRQRAGCSATDGKPLRGQLVEIWQANAAGRYRARRRQARRAARPELLRRRPLPDRRRRPLPVRHDQAGRVPVGEPPERVAAGPHPLLAVRPRVHRAARHADVLPRRPAVRLRPDLPVDPRRARARAAGQQLRPRR